MIIKSDYYIQVNGLGRYRVVRQEETADGIILQVYGEEDLPTEQAAKELIEFQKSLDEVYRKKTTWVNLV
jgi:hypothetical protein